KKVEIQIRTESMHRTAEDGIAAHWRYKEGRLQEDELDKHMGWLRQVLEAVDEEEVETSSFMEHLKVNLFQDEVFVFTPRGDLYRLPVHSTPVDFAFAVHTDIGLHCLAAKVNGRIVPLSHQLVSGDTVEIITSANQRPNEGWLSFATSAKAKGRIKKWLRDTQFESSARLGEEMLTRALSKYSIKFKDVNLADLASKFSQRDAQQLLAALGRGEIKLDAVLHKIIPEDKPVTNNESLFKRFIERARKSSKGVSVAGMDNIMISFGKCCNPVPGDPITGIVTRGRGIVVHTNSCNNLLRLMQEPERIIDVAWDVDKENRFLAGLYILCERRSRFLADLSEAVSSSDGIITSANMNADISLVNCTVSIEVYDLDHLNRIIAKIKKVAGVISVSRWSEPK
ncbi:MAG TPA: DUF5913 domain-containing protein, partial [bacterium]|nr:DUF5913 domain-containing protein [bacterium]